MSRTFRSRLGGLVVLSALAGLFLFEFENPYELESNAADSVPNLTPEQRAAAQVWKEHVEYHTVTRAQGKETRKWIRQLGKRIEDNSFVGTAASDIEQQLKRSNCVLHLPGKKIYSFYMFEKRTKDQEGDVYPQLQFCVDNDSGKISQVVVLDPCW